MLAQGKNLINCGRCLSYWCYESDNRLVWLGKPNSNRRSCTVYATRRLLPVIGRRCNNPGLFPGDSAVTATGDSHSSPVPHGGRLPQLDALRGLAALWVMFYHWTVRYDEIYGHASQPFSLPDGRHGVYLFFMISGFVILMTLDKIRSVRDFVFFRFARLYPTLWTCAACTLAVVAVLGLPGREVTLKDALMNITMVPYTLGFQFVDQSYWSLEVELFFYGLMAIIVALGLRRWLVPVLALLVLMNIGALLLPGPVTALPKVIKLMRLLLSMRYLHLFLFGIVCYEMMRDKKGWHWLLLVLCVSVSFFEDEFTLVRSGMVALLGVLFWAGTRFNIPPLQNRVLLFFGLISYPLYVLHQNIGYALIRSSYQAGWSGIAGLAIASVVVVPLAFLVSSRIELPANRMLRDWYRRRYY